MKHPAVCNYSFYSSEWKIGRDVEGSQELQRTTAKHCETPYSVQPTYGLELKPIPPEYGTKFRTFRLRLSVDSTHTRSSVMKRGKGFRLTFREEAREILRNLNFVMICAKPRVILLTLKYGLIVVKKV